MNLFGKTTITISWNEEPLVLDFSQKFQIIDIIPYLEKKLEKSIPLNSPDLKEFLINILDEHGIKMPSVITESKLMDRLISTFIEPECMQPTFVTGHPLFMSPLAKSKVFI